MTDKREGPVIYRASPITDHDIYLFKEGSHFTLYKKLGAHPMTMDGVEGTHFAVWAPDAIRVSVVGDFNFWTRGSHPLRVRDDWSGIWEGFVPGVLEGALYKYHIVSRHNGYRVDKADPFAMQAEVPPKTASVVRRLNYEWNDGEWMTKRGGRNSLEAPISIYELHPGSWRRVPE